MSEPSVIFDQDQGAIAAGEQQLSLECPHCGTYAHMTPQSVPDAAGLLRERPEQVGLVYQCDACRAPVFLRFSVRGYHGEQVELSRHFVELERPKERFAYSYLPADTQTLFREALACYSANNFNAFASMCRRSAVTAFAALGEGGKLRAFEEVATAREIASLDDNNFAPLKAILFDTGPEDELPLISRAQAGVLLEITKDMFYQCFVRHGKLTRALKVRQFFVDEARGSLQTA